MKLPPNLRARKDTLKVLESDEMISKFPNIAMAETVESLGSKNYTAYPNKHQKLNNNGQPSYWLVCEPENQRQPFNGTSFGFSKDGPESITNTLHSLEVNAQMYDEIIKSELCRWVSRRLAKENYKVFSALEVMAPNGDGEATVNLILPKIMPTLVGEIAIALENEYQHRSEEPNTFLETIHKPENNISIAKKLGLSALYYVGKTLKQLPES
ncbi:hypothetical protein KA025_00270 [Candidatus Saccharibacteria bacterium]|jgi:hypothetical protein|nr:hypothetical protein [Candidatus Saccharibacteria bacterium]MBP7834506.1 hypothetical protein [Candidatus Saccharibacteria bacterium]